MHGRALIQSQVYESQVSLMPSSAEEEKENHHTGQQSVVAKCQFVEMVQ